MKYRVKENATPRYNTVSKESSKILISKGQCHVKVCQINIWGDALRLQEEPLSCLKISYFLSKSEGLKKLVFIIKNFHCPPMQNTVCVAWPAA
jgi:hypothetical protein